MVKTSPHFRKLIGGPHDVVNARANGHNGLGWPDDPGAGFKEVFRRVNGVHGDEVIPLARRRDVKRVVQVVAGGVVQKELRVVRNVVMGGLFAHGMDVVNQTQVILAQTG